MAYKIDKRTPNKENCQDAPMKLKQMQNTAHLSVKKAFGEIKNVIHNATPCRAAKIDGLPGVFSASKSLCNDVLRKQQLKQNFANAQSNLELKYKVPSSPLYNDPVFDEELFDSWDIDRKCCKEQKRDEEIWAEMNMLHIDLVDSKFGDDFDQMENKENFIPESYDDFDIILNDEEKEVKYKEDDLDLPNLPTLPDWSKFNEQLLL